MQLTQDSLGQQGRGDHEGPKPQRLEGLEVTNQPICPRPRTPGAACFLLKVTAQSSEAGVPTPNQRWSCAQEGPTCQSTSKPLCHHQTHTEVLWITQHPQDFVLGQKKWWVE